MNKIAVIAIMWVFISLAYVILAVSMPAVQDFSDLSVTTMQAGSNMSNYPGMAEATGALPLIAWFIPGGLGIIVTVATLRSDKD